MARRQEKKTKTILCTYEYLTETPLVLYNTLSSEICGPNNYFKIFVIFSKDALTTNIFIKSKAEINIVHAYKFIVNEITPCVEKVSNNQKSLTDLIPINEIQFDFDMEYHKYLLKKEIPIELPASNQANDSKEYINAKLNRIISIKGRYNRSTAKFQKAIKKISDKLSIILEKEEYLVNKRVNLLNKKNEDPKLSLLQQNMELQKKVIELENLLAAELPVKRTRNCEIIDI